MRLSRQSVIDAIDAILKAADKADAEWEKAVEVWRKQEYQKWLKEQRPRYAAFAKVIAKADAEKRPIAPAEVSAIFESNRYSGYTLPTYNEDAIPPSEVKIGRKTIQRPPRVDNEKLAGVKQLLLSVQDDYVSDSVLARLGIKDKVTQVFTLAVQMGALSS